jgi:hypothetical protein
MVYLGAFCNGLLGLLPLQQRADAGGHAFVISVAHDGKT